MISTRKAWLGVLHYNPDNRCTPLKIIPKKKVKIRGDPLLISLDSDCIFVESISPSKKTKTNEKRKTSFNSL